MINEPILYYANYITNSIFQHNPKFLKQMIVHFPSIEFALFFYLLEVASYKDSTSFSLPISEICSDTRLTVDEVKKAREKLSRKAYIDYISKSQTYIITCMHDDNYKFEYLYIVLEDLYPKHWIE